MDVITQQKGCALFRQVILRALKRDTPAMVEILLMFGDSGWSILNNAMEDLANDDVPQYELIPRVLSALVVHSQGPERPQPICRFFTEICAKLLNRPLGFQILSAKVGEMSYMQMLAELYVDPSFSQVMCSALVRLNGEEGEDEVVPPILWSLLDEPHVNGLTLPEHIILRAMVQAGWVADSRVGAVLDFYSMAKTDPPVSLERMAGHMSAELLPNTPMPEDITLKIAACIASANHAAQLNNDKQYDEADAEWNSIFQLAEDPHILHALLQNADLAEKVCDSLLDRIRTVYCERQ
jgi:hypothetical protein